MKIDWVTGSGTVMIDAVFKMCLPRTLLPAVFKRSFGKDSTFLIAFESAAIVAVLFISGASCTGCQCSIT
jgi:hypothetical protein